MPTYPPPPPVITGDAITISRFLASPTAVQRRLREISNLRFISDVLLTGRYQATAGGVLYETGEPIFTDREPKVVNPGAEYSRSTAGRGTAAWASTSKWGQDVPLTDEAVGRYGAQELERTLRKVANTITRRVDTVSLTAIGAAITQTQPAVAGWSNASADPFLDVMLADAQIEALDEGYETDTLVLKDVLYARMVANQKVLAGLSRERTNTVTESGDILAIAGKRVLRSNRLPAGVDVLLVDTDELGGLGYERIPSPEYEGDPATGIESWARRDPDGNDQWLVRGRRPVVPIVREPQSGIKVTGAAA